MAFADQVRIEGDGDARIARLGSTVLGRWDPTYGWEADLALTALECRYLADRGLPHPAHPTGQIERPRTDLHTHFAGCVRGPDLVRIGAEQRVVYPRALFALAGIEAPQMRLDEASDRVRDRLARALSLPVDAPCTHQDMNRIYALRRPLTKHRPSFPSLCETIAIDYAAMGVEYVELSLFDILDLEVLGMASECLPRIRAETGVDLRFLAALSRHDDLEWDLDMIHRLEAYAASPVLVGVDFMGHETNSTRAFLANIEAVARFVREVRPDFMVRVHAGENPMFPENVRVALDALVAAEVGVRIGHGLYGVDDATLERIVSAGAIVEFNLDSNFALNNVGDALQVPLARYVAAGAAVVLGTDGYGIYHGDSPSQARAARLSGLTSLDSVWRTESAFLATRRAADARLTGPFVVPLAVPEPVHFTEEVARRLAAERSASSEALATAIAEIGVPLVERSGLPEGPWASIAGSWKHAWMRLDAGEQERVREIVEVFIAGVAVRGMTVLTGGTVHGVEGLVHAAARRHGVQVVGVVVDATPAADLDRVSMYCRVARTLYDKAAGLYALIAERDGFAIFIGGGNIVHDEIRVATNLRLRRAFVAGLPGASGLAATRWPRHGVRDGQALLARLEHGARAPDVLWFEGPNPCGDIVCVRGGTEVLLVQRRVEVAAEGGRWALPGGFVGSAGARGEPWREGKDTARSAALRELAEETGLDVRWMEDALVPVGVFEGGSRDPRDGSARWSRSHVYRLDLPAHLGEVPLVGDRDTAGCRWFSLASLPPLAFDHGVILARAAGQIQ